MSEQDTEDVSSEVLDTEERYVDCEECGGSIDTLDAGYYKTPDERFKHKLCHENVEVPEGYVWKVEDTSKACTNKQYNCGHTIFAPRVDHPTYCPECNDIDPEVSN